MRSVVVLMLIPIVSACAGQPRPIGSSSVDAGSKLGSGRPAGDVSVKEVMLNEAAPCIARWKQDTASEQSGKEERYWRCDADANIKVSRAYGFPTDLLESAYKMDIAVAQKVDANQLSYDDGQILHERNFNAWSSAEAVRMKDKMDY
jgi:hypothetical protein